MKNAFVTTAFGFEGYRVAESLGVVRGITVRSRSIIGNVVAMFEAIIGGRISMYTELCERSRLEAYDLMRTHAMELGANAVIGMRYDANEVAAGITEVLCYGTAVRIEKIGQP
ncbi:YbjQ family protein [Fundidesulfovibrio agrisoli]|uniref:YbjQ family protein n=1 Tax=Fundidesulfovibrio agrisoli TaxID=2922717 RepID=UPI001FAB9F6F|nr:YbjQ family protein [Fundidesulfovibrio agrisoli]